MEELKDKYLKFNPNTLEVVRANYGFKNSKAINDAVDILEDWIKKQRHFIKKDYDRNYLERALIRNKGSIERTKKRLDSICTFRTLMPNLFGDFDIRNDFEDFDGIMHQVLVPRMTKNHDRIAILRNCGKKFNSNLVSQYFKWTFMMVEFLNITDYANSYIIIIDYKDVNLTDLATNLNIVDLQQGMTVMTEAYGVRLNKIHIISPSKMVDLVVKIFKQILSEKLGNRIMVHKDLGSLHKEVPRDILPKDLGGEEKIVEDLYEDMVTILEEKSYRQYLKLMSEAATDESLRQKDTFNEEYLGMPGTFRTLSVD